MLSKTRNLEQMKQWWVKSGTFTSLMCHKNSKLNFKSLQLVWCDTKIQNCTSTRLYDDFSPEIFIYQKFKNLVKSYMIKSVVLFQILT